MIVSGISSTRVWRVVRSTCRSLPVMPDAMVCPPRSLLTSGRSNPNLPRGALQDFFLGLPARRLRRLGDELEVFHQHPVELRLCRLVLASEHGGGMERGHGLRRPAGGGEAPVLLHQPEVGPEERASAGGGHTDHDSRLNDTERGLPPPPPAGALG